MRCFIAIEVPGEIKEKIISLQKEIEKSNADLKFVENENLHLTLKFLGEIDEEKIKEINAIIEEITKDTHKFKIQLSMLGVFPNFNYLRVIWVGVTEGKNEILELHSKLDSKLREIGIKKDEQFETHLTIARVRSARNKDLLIKKIKEFYHTQIGEFEVDEIKLKKSTLTSTGPIYTDLRTFKLV
ncbi:MAG: RNA 2',3'-cyclic phosphodiesterase [Candidatus Parvarchaeota archaeon]|nr:RNA 2',3'-cyclic phosphodiesterase [Candidatus Jingweiarchaeum tengchongense]MCW1298370.1 RNA 2',3'-cyclic phosphodiesterase [Candidatus Jingweiarchaeum tengchongense]MCW1300328.1 RNA 2',3'-cyclic phosphodiesterase [Candidatus Jingweiarchaeum tengchongense]MCW1304875.1 RNA 2',3'-cyclic phosphodiesterase [Candidatus Jingweiarchaeum tengchongense]MCW1305824.1 RNA 2',3'-cyclic phosphodiesterase [Candidatus Jingweiarchaeum tengchongense]